MLNSILGVSGPKTMKKTGFRSIFRSENLGKNWKNSNFHFFQRKILKIGAIMIKFQGESIRTIPRVPKWVKNVILIDFRVGKFGKNLEKYEKKIAAELQPALPLFLGPPRAGRSETWFFHTCYHLPLVMTRLQPGYN